MICDWRSHIDFMPILIRRGVKLPPRWKQSGFAHEIRTVLTMMNVGDSFVLPERRKQIYRIANDLGVRIKTQKLNGSGYGVERIG